MVKCSSVADFDSVFSAACVFNVVAVLVFICRSEDLARGVSIRRCSPNLIQILITHSRRETMTDSRKKIGGREVLLQLTAPGLNSLQEL